MHQGGREHAVLIVGDNDAREHIRAAAAAGAIPPARLAELEALYSWKGDLVIADAGAGMIHGQTADFADNPSARVVYVHTGDLPAEERHLYTLARAGYRYTVVAGDARPSPLERGLAHKALAGAFGHQSGEDGEWLNAMLDAAEALSVNRGQIVLRRNEGGDDLYVTLTGELRVLAEQDGDVTEVARVHAGEVFGEMAVINDAPRSASIEAATPARLLRVPGSLFRSFARQAALVTTLPDVWRKRAALEAVPMLRHTSVTTRNVLAQHAVERTIEPGATLIREGSRSNTVFVLVAGRVQVYKGHDPLLVDGAPVIVEPGTFLGETAPFLHKARNASIVAIDECEVLAVRGADFARVVESSPQLFRCISQIVKARAA
jgi:CRP-like cAMP-binding protein